MIDACAPEDNPAHRSPALGTVRVVFLGALENAQKYAGIWHLNGQQDEKKQPHL